MRCSATGGTRRENAQPLTLKYVKGTFSKEQLIACWHSVEEIRKQIGRIVTAGAAEKATH